MTFTLQQTCQSHLSHWTPSTSQMSRTGPTTTASTEAYTRSNAGTRLGWITGNHHRASLCWTCTTNSTRGRASRPPHRPDKSSIRIWCWVQRSGRGSNGSAEGASDQKGSQSLGARSAMALNASATTRTNSCLHQIQSEGRNWLAEVGSIEPNPDDEEDKDSSQETPSFEKQGMLPQQEPRSQQADRKDSGSCSRSPRPRPLQGGTRFTDTFEDIWIPLALHLHCRSKFPLAEFSGDLDAMGWRRFHRLLAGGPSTKSRGQSPLVPASTKRSSDFDGKDIYVSQIEHLWTGQCSSHLVSWSGPQDEVHQLSST